MELGNAGQVSLNSKEGTRASQKGHVFDQGYGRLERWLIAILLTPCPVLAQVSRKRPVRIGRSLQASPQILPSLLMNLFVDP